MRRGLLVVGAVGAAFGGPAPEFARAQDPDAGVRKVLSASMKSAGPASGAYVLDASEGRRLFSRRARVARILASNTKLFTTAAALERLGPHATFTTRVLGTGRLDAAGTWRGNLVLQGGGDPTFGSRAFARKNYVAPGGVEDLAAQVSAAGVRAVSGRVVGEEALFDSLRGGPDSGYKVSQWVGPLSALTFDRARAAAGGWASDPRLQAAIRLDAELERLGIRVARTPARRRSRATGTALAAVASPRLGRLAEIANVRSDNFFAEILLKHLGPRPGSTDGGARDAVAVASELGVSARLVDGSGLSRSNRATPEQVARMLARIRDRPTWAPFFDSLPVAGREGTLSERMTKGPARDRCRGKTGSLTGVSTLSGYCQSVGGDLIVFSFLMERVKVEGARRLQDRMVEALARYRG